MPALATRQTGPATESRPAGPREIRSRASGPPGHVSERLSHEFVTIPAETVDRCVEDVWACAAHLGVDATPTVVERIARERLLAVAGSAPLIASRG
ncbi:hypothetical protein [Sphaerisporangium sp. NPDC051011]|uniref:hypothetical protein n=1 Tax=Sphaerisporangium sp. NPDC051011 TaxID=3155792 RepID=UPI0033CE3289